MLLAVGLLLAVSEVHGLQAGEGLGVVADPGPRYPHHTYFQGADEMGKTHMAPDVHYPQTFGGDSDKKAPWWQYSDPSHPPPWLLPTTGDFPPGLPTTPPPVTPRMPAPPPPSPESLTFAPDANPFPQEMPGQTSLETRFPQDLIHGSPNTHPNYDYPAADKPKPYAYPTSQNLKARENPPH